MGRRAKYRPGFCQLCGKETDIIVSAYRTRPFIDGRCYEEMCFVCSEVPKTAEYFQEYHEGNKVHKEVIVYYNGFDQDKLCTVDELVVDGFDKNEVKRSVQAVKKAIKNGIPLPKPKPLPVGQIPFAQVVAYVPTAKPIVEEENMGRKKNKRRGRRGGKNNSHQNKYFQAQSQPHTSNKQRKQKHKLPDGPLQREVTIREIAQEY